MITYLQAKKCALRSLARRSYSSFELKKLLLEKEAVEDDIDRILVEMEGLGYLDDAGWVERFIALQQEKKVGPRTIAMKLREKGIPEVFFSSFLENASGLEVQKEQIVRLLSSRYKNKSLEDFKERGKVFAALVRKGFSFEVIREVLDRD